MLQVLFRCCLVRISIILQRHFLYFLYLCPYPDLGLHVVSMWSFFILIFIFIMVNHIISWIQTHTCYFAFRICSIIFGWWRVWRMCIILNYQKFSFRVLLSICLIFNQFQPGVAYKSVAYKKNQVVVEKYKLYGSL